MIIKKDINLREARVISEFFCKNMDVTYCEIYYVDRLENENIGIYIATVPPIILMIEDSKNKLTLLMHELIHHLDACKYTDLDFGESLNHSSNGYISAKRHVINWCEKNISNKICWKKMLKHKLNEEEIKKFKL